MNAKPAIFNYGLLRFLRDDHGWSRNDMLDRLETVGLEIHYNTLVNWENGVFAPNAEDLPKIATILGVSVEDFYRPATARQAA